MKSPRVLLAIAAAAVALTGCSSPVQAGAAAIVGDERISAEELSRVVADYERELKAANIDFDQWRMERRISHSMAQLVLSQLVYTEQIKQIGEKHGVAVTDGELSAAERQVVENNRGIAFDTVVLNVGLPKAEGRELLRATVIQQKLAPRLGATDDNQLGEALSKELAAIPVKFHPRYGTYVASNGSFTDGERFGKLEDPYGAGDDAASAGQTDQAGQ